MGEAFFGLALGLHAQQLRRVVEDRFFRRLARGLPGAAAELVELRGPAAQADVFPDQVRLFQGDAQQGTAAVFQNQLVALIALLDALETADTVFVVHDQISHLHLVDAGAGTHAAGFFQQRTAWSARRAVAPEKLR